jgi:hypothetical protein
MVEPVTDSGTGVAKTDGGREPSGDAGHVVDAGARDAGLVVLGDAGLTHCSAAYNAVENSGFECPDLTRWSVSDGFGTVIDGGHGGSKSMQLVANARGAVGVGQNNAVADTGGQTHCARLWVRGTAPQMRLEVRASPSGTGTAFSSPVGSADWVKVPPGGALVVTTMRGESLSILAKTQNADAGETLVVDDVELWGSPTGLCDEH